MLSEDGPLLVSRRYGENLLLCFVGGDLALQLEAQGEQAMVDFALDHVATFFGTAAARFDGRSRVTRRASDPSTLGSYTSSAVGGAAHRQQLNVPLAHRIFFAGEAASIQSHNTVLGAWEAAGPGGPHLTRR